MDKWGKNSEQKTRTRDGEMDPDMAGSRRHYCPKAAPSRPGRSLPKEKAMTGSERKAKD